MPNGRAPYGYHCIRKSQARDVPEFKDKDGQFVVVEDEAKVVRELFERYAAGATLRGLAVLLQERGTQTRNGLPFRRSVVLQLLQNPAYKGTPEYNKREYFSGSHSSYRVRPAAERIELQCPPLVTVQLWETVAARLKENQTAMAGRPSPRYLPSAAWSSAALRHGARHAQTHCVGQRAGAGRARMPAIAGRPMGGGPAAPPGSKPRDPEGVGPARPAGGGDPGAPGGGGAGPRRAGRPGGRRPEAAVGRRKAGAGDG